MLKTNHFFVCVAYKNLLLSLMVMRADWATQMVLLLVYRAVIVRLQQGWNLLEASLLTCGAWAGLAGIMGAGWAYLSVCLSPLLPLSPCSLCTWVPS